MASSHYQLIHGPDTYQSAKLLQAIQDRFRTKDASTMVDLVVYDMEETPLDTLKQSLLTIPFLVSHRLFILRRTFQAPKAVQEGLAALLPTLGASTVVVLYESKSCDQRLSLYQWFKKHGTIQECANPEGYLLTERMSALAKESKVTLSPTASTMLASMVGQDMAFLAQEIKKLSAYCLAENRQQIEEEDVRMLCFSTVEPSLFALTDALRGNDSAQVVAVARASGEDPMLLAGTLAGAIRTYAKIHLALDESGMRPDELARATKLNPYVIKLSRALASAMSPAILATAYRALVRFERDTKDGRLPSDLALLLLILRLHGTVKKAAARSF